MPYHIGMTHNRIDSAETPPVDVETFRQNTVADSMNSLRRSRKVIIDERDRSIMQRAHEVFELIQYALGAPGPPSDTVKAAG